MYPSQLPCPSYHHLLFSLVLQSYLSSSFDIPMKRTMPAFIPISCRHHVYSFDKCHLSSITPKVCICTPKKLLEDISLSVDVFSGNSFGPTYVTPFHLALCKFFYLSSILRLSRRVDYTLQILFFQQVPSSVYH